MEIQRQQMCQMKQKSERKAAVAAEEEAYRQQMMDKFAYDDKDRVLFFLNFLTILFIKNSIILKNFV